MRKLTKDERIMVEENHNLIYSFLHNRGLDVEEYYGLVAESLCKTAIHWDEDRGNFSTLFYSIATSDLYREWRKVQAQKRSNEGELPLEHSILPSDYDLECDVLVRDTIDRIEDSKYSELFKLRMEGKTQEEIGDRLGVSRTTVGRKLREVGDKYFD